MFAPLPPVVVAPMAGGPSTPELVTAAGRAGSLGFLAAGYKTPAATEGEIRTLRQAGFRYGLNIFTPMPPPPDPRPIERYRRTLESEARRYGVALPPIRLSDDDHFADKVDLAVTYGVPLVSFTFGVPPRAAVAALRAAGCAVLITVTSAEEAARAHAVRPDGLIAQGGAAGGHSATTAPAGYRGETSTKSVLSAVVTASDLPVIAAGGTATAADVHGLRTAGAAAVQCGTAFLLGRRRSRRGAPGSAGYPAAPAPRLNG